MRINRNLESAHLFMVVPLCCLYLSSLYTAVNAGVIIQSINHVKSGFMTLPLWITIIGSLALAIYMLIISIKRKSTFNR